MGSSASTNASIDTKLIDRIATDYILSMNFQDMMDMTTESGCGKMVLVVEDILKKIPPKWTWRVYKIHHVDYLI